VLRQFVLGVEELVAGQTDVGTVLLVDAAHVFLQMWQLQEGRRAQLALERLFARMQSDVQFQRRRVRKGLLADFALVWPLSSVRPHVHLQLRPLSEAVVAGFTAEGLFVGVRTEMLEEVSFEGALANRALERFHAAVVAAQVFAKPVTAGESFAAHRARIVTLPRVPSHVHLEIG